MNNLTDAEFCAWLDTLQTGGTVPDDFPAADAADLAFAGRLFELRLTPATAPLTPAQFLSAASHSFNENLEHPRLWQRAVDSIRPMLNRPASPMSARARVVLSLASLAGLLILFTVTYPPARALADQIIQKITFGRITVVYQEATEAAPIPAQPPEDNWSPLWTSTTLAEVRAKYPAMAHLPGWVPPGYTRQERVALYYFDAFTANPNANPAFAIYEWKNSQDDSLQLEVFTAACYHGSTFDPAVGCDFQSFISSDPAHPAVLTKVNGQTAVLQQGGGWRPDFSGPANKWNPTHYRPNRDDSHSLWLIWEKGPAEYLMSASSGDVSQKDLIHIAESIQ